MAVYWNWKLMRCGLIRFGIMLFTLFLIYHNIDWIDSLFLPTLPVGKILFIGVGFVVLRHIYRTLKFYYYWIRYGYRHRLEYLVSHVCVYLIVASVALSVANASMPNVPVTDTVDSIHDASVTNMGTPINTTDTPVPVSNLLDMPTLDNVSNMPPTHLVNVKDTVINCTIDENAITESTLWIESNTYLAGADGHTITFARNPNAKDPTYDELINFIQNDTTDQHPYVDGQYVCADYAEDVQHNAEAAGYKCGYVVINFIDGPGHACNAFNTFDDGLVYIDCTPHVGPVMGGNTDYYAHIQDGEAYNSYPISGHEEGDTSPMGIVKSHKIYWG